MLEHVDVVGVLDRYLLVKERIKGVELVSDGSDVQYPCDAELSEFMVSGGRLSATEVEVVQYLVRGAVFTEGRTWRGCRSCYDVLLSRRTSRV